MSPVRCRRSRSTSSTGCTCSIRWAASSATRRSAAARGCSTRRFPASGWGSRDINWDASELLVTTGGAQQTIVSFSHGEQRLRVYRPNGDVFYTADRLTTAKPTSLDAVIDGSQTVHACFTADGVATTV